jgi:amino acid adenylation domain-containing protein
MSTPMIEGHEAMPHAGAIYVPALADPALRPRDAVIAPGACVHDLFGAQAARTPEAVALSWRGERLTYAQLEARANRLANALRRRGVGPEVRVGICLPRTPELVAAMLGVLKAGGAYVPLDPAYPRERLGYMLQDAGVTLVITDSDLADRLPESAAGLLLLDRERDAIATESAAAPESGAGPENLSHVIFTSGSTGRPKGVMIRHASTVVLLHWLRENVTDEERSSVLFSTSINFDVSIAEVFGTLAWGGKLVIAENALELATLGEEVVYASMVPSAAAELLRSGGIPACVKTLNLGGEALPNALAQGLYALGTVEKVGNLYGPTEDTTYSTYYLVPRGADPMLVGTPVDNTQAYVLDEHLQPVPAGVVGELYLAGDGLSRGYANGPALTAERFVPCPFGAPGARMYRVMDRVRWRESAEVDSVPADSRTNALTHLRTAVLEYLGRTDFQVKVRGYRIELGEIEARLAEHPGVHAPVVLVREDAPGDPRLVAYYLADQPVAVDALKSHLADRLPGYMVPAAYVWMEAYPLTPNGKVDRKAFPAPDSDAYAVQEYEAPVGETEQAVAAIWVQVLGAERVGRRDSLFELGGHSLLAMQVISRVREALGVEVPLEALFERPVLADFARGVETAARAEATAIAPVDRTAAIPLSFAQQRLWFLEQLGGTGTAYHIPLRLRLRGALDRDALVRALDRIVARHEALRTTFPAVDGEPVQRIAPVEESGFRLVEHDLHAAPDAEDGLRRLVQDEASAPFDLEQGPLFRGRLVRMAADDHVLLLTMHHIVSDGWSLGVLHRELGALYAAFARGDADPLPSLPVQYADYAAWHRRWVSGHAVEAQAEYWTRTLAGAPELLELPADRPRPAKQDFAGASLQIELDEALTAALRTLSQRHGTTLYMTLLAGWTTVLARLSGQDDVVVGTPSAGRGNSEIEGLIGFFVNTLALRVDLSGSPSVAELLGRVKERALEAQRHQDLPFEQVVERVQPARSLSHTPVFQAMLAWQEMPGGELELPGIAAAPLDGVEEDAAPFDLTLSLEPRGGRIAGTLAYATALFDRATVERHAGYLRRVLEEMAADEDQAVDRLDLLDAAERRLVVEEWNATDAGYPAGACVHDLFDAQAARTPEAVALSWHGERLTYAQLEARANQLANALRRRGVAPEVRVGICLPRTPELVAAMLGVLKAGGAYVPLDPAYPRERLGYMLQDAGVTLVITDSDLADRLPESAAGLLLLDRERDAIAAESATAPEGGAVPENLSHVIFTSGSTGRPKGVMIRHASTVVLLHWLRENVTDEERSSVLFATSINFDVSIAEVFGTLAWGGKLVIVENALELATLGEDVVYASMVPSAAAELLRSGGIPACVKTLNLGGEALPNALAQGLYALGTVEKVGNLYGPTEDTTYSTYYLVPRGADQVLVGTPVSNTQAYVLDHHLQPVPAGVVGELYLAGDGLSRGYANHPAMTAERFVPCPFGAPGARMYRVMDRVRWRESAGVGSVPADSRTDALTHSRTAVLEYLGRTDFQVKVRGYRIELGEIEARLAEHAGVRAPVVLVREDAPGDRRLVAYYLADQPVAVDALKSHLATRLPGYMVPAAYVRMEAYPLTPNGKVDRKAFPAPDGDAYAAREYEAPAGETEQAVAAIWAEVLGAERVGRRDNFFELGGHSLMAVRVVSRARQVLGVEAQPGDLFERPVLADFARGVETAARAEAMAIVPVDRTAAIPLSFAQQRLWFSHQMGGTGAAYHIPMRLRLRGALDRDALVRALDRIVARHEALRTTFPAVDGEPVQRIAPVEESAFGLVEHNLHGRLDAEDELSRLVSDEASAPFDLEHGPLFRGRLVRMAADDHVLLLTMHHIVSDGWSLGVLHRELGALYAAFARGDADPLPPLPVQYADYAVWHRRLVEGEVLRRQADYWRETLTGAPELLELPADRPRPAKQDFAGASLKVELDEALTAALRTLSQRHGATLYMTLLAGWAAVLARLSGQDEVVVGTPSANRGRSEIEGLIGFFVNTLALRVDLSGSPSVAELLGRVKERALGAQHHQDIPFEQVVELVQPVRSLTHTPLFQVMFAWQNAPGSRLELPGLALDLSDSAGSPSQVNTEFDLSLVLWEDGGRIEGEVEYATALFERETVERWLAYLRRALEGMVADERGSVERLELLPDAERRRVVEEFNDRRVKDPREAFVHERFEAQVERTPGAAAVVFEDETLSYAEVNARANRLAHHLRSLGVGPDARVGICVERSPAMVVGLLAVLKAGGAYVPLDPDYPADRLAYMLADSAPVAVLVQTHLRDRVERADVPVIELDAAAPAWASLPATDPRQGGLTPDQLAYVIYTSGSTGRPKGVRVSHESLAATMAVAGDAFGFGAGDHVPSLASFAFDIWLFEALLPLLRGGTVQLVARDRVLDVPRLVEDLARCTALHAVPALMRGIVAEVRATPEGVLGTLRHAFVGGDAVAPDLLEEMRIAFPAAEIHVLYGPTEAAIICASHRLGGEAAARQMLGRPLGNAALYVVEPGGRVAPVGVPGELCLGGASVARDYLGRPGLTAERFVPDPFAGQPGARLYRTGDRVRWLPDGSLEFLGRTDHQVKVRGFRIEPGEIEARLAEHAGVRAAVVLVREDAPGEKRLVAYVAGDETAGADVLRAHLSERLPEYMVPAAYVRLETLPLTPNGKVDRKALPAPEGDAFPARGYEAPSGKAEEAVAAIWAELLGAERVGRRDHFFELGGHSLLAVRVVSRVRQALGVEASPRDVFERPVLADFARGVQTAARAEAAAIERVDRTGNVPLSFAQQRMWFLEQLGNLGSTYQLSMSLRLQGDLDRGALVRSLDRIVARHEALRTTFPVVDGEPVQHIAPVEESGFQLVEHDLRASADAEDELRRLVQDEASATFDLAHGPLFRGRLVRMAADDHVLLLTMHHIVSDGWSLGVLHRELGALYAAFARGEPDPLPPLPVQYADYADWHRRWVEGPVLEAQAEYWTRTLAGAPELLELPADHPRPAKQDFAGASLNVEFDEALTAALRTLSQRHGATLHMTLLAGWAAVLARLSGQDEVVVGTPSANRGRSEIEDLIGFFVNTLPVRVDLSGAPTVAEALGRVKARALEAQQNQDIPFEQVVERVQPARSLAHSPLFQVMFAWQNAPGESLELPGLRLSLADAGARATAKFDLLLSLWEEDGRITGDVEYATSLFEQATVERWLGYLRRVLEAMAADDALGVDRLPMLPPAERRLVLREFNDTRREYPREACVHELFQAQAARTPESVAVVFEGERVTYAELNARANRLAHHLRALGVGPDARVGICVERSVEMVVGLLGILKAGGAYVPLDASYPVDRLRNMLEDSAPAVLLTHPPQAATTAALSAGSAIPVLDLTGDQAWAVHPATNPGRDGLGPENLAHVLFTSGSTGRPKGVMLEHGSLVNRLAWMQDRYGMEPGEALLQKTPFSFDVSFWEFFWPLMVGARLVMARPGGHRDPAYLADVIRREGVTVAHFVPSMLQVFLEHPDAAACSGLLRVPVSGEAVSAALARQFHERLPGVGLFNQYGPTESGEVTEWASDPAAERVSIGRAIHNSAVYVLDRAGEPVPVGAAGELFIGGVAVARGYLGRPRLTAERFVPDPFGQPGARLYRTGDLCRWLADGTLEYLGRTDFQVKVRGFRVEPGEIEARLASHPGVREAVVLALDDGAGGKRLVAYFVGEALESEALRAHLSQQLPEYMVPAAFVRLDAFPVTPNGKLDRRALPAPDADAFAARAYEAPVGEVENVLAGIWSELLGVERVGRGDHFFALGGHSLLAVRVVSRVRRALGVDASPAALFERPVLADLARGLETATAQGTAIVPVERGGPLPLSFAQQRLWFIEQMEGAGASYHLPVRLRLKGGLDRDALMRALERIVARHEALRTSFPETDGVPAQRISAAEERPFHLVEDDLEGRPEAPAELGRLMAEEAGAPFDLARGPLVRGRLIRLAGDDHVLLITMHHIVSDGWSLGIFTRELGALYAAFVRGDADPLPPLPVQYADYTVWQRRRVDGDVLRRQADYWGETLSGAPELLELPADRPRPARQDFTGASVKVELDEALVAGVTALSRRHGTTPFMTVLAGWAVVLSRLSGQDDVVVGTPAAGRGSGEVEGLIGFFVNTLPVRVDLSGAPTVAEALRRVKARALEAQQNQDVPFEQVVERVRPARSLAHTPIFQAMLAWQEMPGGALELPGLDVARLDAVEDAEAQFDLSLGLTPGGGRITGDVIYATALFDRATVERYVGYLRRVLEEMAADDSTPVNRLELLSAAERRRVVEEWNATDAVPPAGACVHQLFEAQVERTPGAEAVAFEAERLTYAELNARANRLAHHLRSLGVGPDARVGICTERSLDMMVGLLGVLKAGGAYVPLDPDYPADRLAYMLADSAPAAVLVQTHLRDRVERADVPVIELNAAAPAWASLPATDPGSGGLTPDHLAYVIYTSGSTGRPKGVRVSHRSLGATMAVAGDAFGFGAGDRVPSLASFAFDIWLFEALLPLLGGGTVQLVPRDRVLDVPRLVEDLARCTALHAVPALMRGIVAEVRATPQGVLDTLRHAFVGGDAVAPDLLEEMRIAFPAAGINVLYGPTEAAIICASHRLGGETVARQMLGRPLGNAALYVVEPGGTVAPVGVPGELCLGGASVARDYLGRPGLTAERFVPDPFAGQPGARLYRTGDRVRWLEESAEVRECVSAEVGSGSADSRTNALTHSRTGVLEFLGRTDHQVKVRGFRIEPGEIEARLAEHPGVRAAVVLVREDAPGEKRLVAYVAGDETAGADVLRAHLSERLPEYMVPAAYVRLETLPLTPNGKVDRKALPAPEGDAFPARGYEAPSGKAEEAVAAIWAELLGAERVGRRDHFFELGGHSLLAVRVVSRVRQALGVEASPRDVFERPVLADFAQGLETAARAETMAIVPVERSGPLPLSFAQQRLWFLQQLGNMGGTYHMPMRLRLRGDLDRGALVRSLDRIVARHEALRTSFPTVDGEPVQHIAPAEGSGVRLVEHDLRASADADDELRRLVQDEAGAPFDLAQGPLVRGRLVRMAADDHVLLLTMHHIVSDGWSTGVLFRELAALYTAFARGEPDPLPPLPVQYADYAVWHRRWVEGPVLEAQAEYWTRTLAGAPELLALPTDHPRPAKQDFAGASVNVELDEALTAALRTLGQRHGTTLFMTLLAGWAAMLARLSGQADVVIGTPSANRGHAEVEDLIGFFVNTLPLRVDLSDGPGVGELLQRVKTRALEAQRNQDIPFEQVVERVRPARSLAYSPLFQVIFAWQNAPGGSLELPGLAIGLADAAESDTAKFDLSLTLWEDGGRIEGAVEYATALFEPATVERWIRYLRRALEEMAADDAKPVDRLKLLSADERRMLVEEWNATDAAFPAGACIHELFEAQAERTPGAVAVAHEDRSLTYAEVNARANRLAHHLRALGVGPQARVAILVPRSIELVVSELAILKTGAAYVPIDPSFPADRIAFMVADSGSSLVLGRAGAGLPTLAGVERVDVDALPEGACHDPRVPLHSGAAAYVMYTSGSTGAPKGVVVPHRAIARLVFNNGYADFRPDDRVAFAANPAFDATTMEVWGPLLTGGRTVVVPQDVLLDPDAFARTLADQQITTLFITTSVFNQYAQAIPGALSSLRLLLTGGEAADPSSFARVLAENGPVSLIHCYGPTETTTFAITHEVTEVEEGARSIPLGRPIANTRIYILNAYGEPVPVGGELYIGGAGVALGYLNRPGLTAERFVPDPFGGEPGARMYRTGDLGRWRPDGTIEFLGRTDHQVKIRGFRIEPGEIEARLHEYPGVRQAVVLAREDAPGVKRLVAYVVGEAAADALRAHLDACLPAYMVPAAYVRLEALPLTSNGKLDRGALPAPDGAAYARRGPEPPRTLTERVLAEIWTELLGVERVGRRDHFFDLGGHSLLAVRLVSRVREALNPAATVEDVFAHPTLYDLAAKLAGTGEWFGTDHAIPVRDTGSERPLFVMHDAVGVVFYGQLLRSHLDAEIPIYALPGPLNSTEELGSLDDLVTRLVRMMTEVQPEGPYRVAGWSAGGIFAYAVAERLVMTGRAVEFVGLLDAFNPAGLPNYDTPRVRQFTVLEMLARDNGVTPATPESVRALKEDTEGMDLPDFIAACKARGLLPETVTLARAEQVDSRIAVLKRAYAEFVPQPLPVPAYLFLSDEEAGDPRRGWHDLPGGAPFRPVRVPGTHHTMWKKGNVEVVGAAISHAIRESAAGAGAGVG